MHLEGKAARLFIPHPSVHNALGQDHTRETLKGHSLKDISFDREGGELAAARQ